MTINISDNNPRISYTATSGQTAFTVPFVFFNDADLNVYINDTLKTITTDYTVTGGDGSTGSITLTSGATSGDIVVITRDVALERTTDFPSSGPFQVASLNTELDTIIAMVADMEDLAERGLRLSDSDTSASLVLADKDARKGTVLAFNATTGAVEVGPTIADTETIASIKADIATLADIEDGTDATDAIQTVAGISSNVTTVAGISSDVTTVAGNNANVTTVAGVSGNVTTVAGISANVTTVAGISSDVTSVAGDATDIGTVATNIANVNTVAANDSNITTVAGQTTNMQNITDNLTAVQNAATNATNAATSASNASTSETNAAASAASAAASFDAFDDRYLGAKPSDPATDNDGDALDAGDQYFNTTDNELKVYNGSAWQSASVVGGTVTSLTTSSLDANGGTIDGTVIGGTTPAAGTFTTLTASGDLTVDTNTLFVDASADAVGVNATTLDATLQVGALNSTGSNRGAVSIKTEASDATIGESAIYIEEQSGAEGYYLGVSSDGGMFFSNSGASIPTLFLGDDDNVGINTTPDCDFHIDGSSVASLRFGNIGTSANSALRISRDDTSVINNNPLGFLEFGGNDSTSNIDAAFAYIGGVADGTHAAGSNATRLEFATTASGSSTPSVAMTLDSSGNLLVGETSTPADVTGLYVKNTDPDDNYAGQLGLKGTATSGAADTGAAIAFEGHNGSGNRSLGQIAVLKENSTVGNNNSYMRFSTRKNPLGNTERMRLTSDGNLGIGTQSPSANLEVNTGAASDPVIQVTNSNAAAYRPSIRIDNQHTGGRSYRMFSTADGDGVFGGGKFSIYDDDAGSSRLTIDNGGSVGIGTTTPSSKGNGAPLTVDRTQSGDLLHLEGAGDVHLRIGESGSNMYLNANNGNAVIEFQTNGTERMRIQSGGGISFNGDTAAANALDDYEEGTFTPTITPASGSYTMSTIQFGYYTKVGRVVHFTIRVATSGSSSPSGAVRISGLPFTSANLSNGRMGVSIGELWRFNTLINNLRGFVDSNDTVIIFGKQENNAGTFVELDATDLDSGGTNRNIFVLTGHYYT